MTGGRNPEQSPDPSIYLPPLHFTLPAGWIVTQGPYLRVAQPEGLAEGEVVRISVVRLGDAGKRSPHEIAETAVSRLTDNRSTILGGAGEPEVSGRTPGGVDWSEVRDVDDRGNVLCADAYRYGKNAAVVTFEASSLALSERYNAEWEAVNVSVRFDRIGSHIPLPEELVGTWIREDKGPTIEVHADGTYISGPISGHWSAIDGGIAFDGRMMVWNTGRASVHGNRMEFRVRGHQGAVHRFKFVRRAGAAKETAS
jgi:hypothetical protein